MWGIRTLTMYGAVLAVAVPGGFYLYECVETLLSPDTGFALDYGTPGGVIRIECDRYSYSLSTGALFATNVTVRKPSGELLAKVPTIHATGLHPNESFAPRVTLEGASLWLRRDANGVIDITRYLEGTAEGGEQRPWQVTLENSEVRLTDGSVVGGSADQLRISSANFAGQGDDVFGTANIDLRGLATSDVTVSKDVSGTLITFSNANIQASRVLNRLRSGYEARYLKEVTPLKLSNAQASGNGSLHVPTGKEAVRLRANVKVITGAVQWEKFQADKATFNGLVTEAGLSGKLTATKGGFSVDSDGMFEYEKSPKFVGNVDFRGLTPALISSLGIAIPRDIKVNSAQGSLALRFEDGAISSSGDVTAAGVSAFGFSTPSLVTRIGLHNDQLLVAADRIVVEDSQVNGSFGFNLKSGALSGTFRAPRLQAKSFKKWLPKDFLDSTANISVFVSGTAAKPILEARGTVDPVFVAGGKKFAYKNAGVAARMVGNEVFIDRVEIDTGSGTAYATGKIASNGAIDINVLGKGLDLKSFEPSLRGTADVQGRVLGTTSAIKYAGKVQGYGIGAQGVKEELLAMVANFRGDSNSLGLSEIEAMHGATQLSGSLGVTFASQAIRGKVDVLGLNIQDLVEAPVVGMVDVKNGIVAGTISKPLITADVESRSILAFNFLGENITAKASYDGSSVRLDNGALTVAGGALKGISASFDQKLKTGTVNANFEKLDLNDILSSAMDTGSDAEGEKGFRLGKDVSLKGTSSGTFTAGLNEKGVSSAAAKGRVDDIHINKAFLGSGDWTIGYDGALWRADALVGSLSEYFRLDALTFAPSTSDLSGEFTTFNTPLKELILAVEPNLNLSPTAKDKIELLTGKVGSYFTVRGTTDKPVVQMEELELTDLKLADQNLGTFTAKGDYKDNKLSITEALLLGPRSTKIVLPFAGAVTVPDKVVIHEGSASLKGDITDGSILNLRGSIFGVPLNRFATIVPELGTTNAYVEQADFKVAGTTTAPELDAKVKAYFKTADPTAPKNDFKFELAADVSAKPIVAANGSVDGFQVGMTAPFWLKSIQGNTTANVRLNPDFSLNTKAPVSAEIKFDGERDITSFLTAVAGIEAGGSGAKLSGGYSLSGTLDNKIFTGDVQIKVDSLRYTSVEPLIGRPIDTVLKDFSANLKVVQDPKDGYRLSLRGATTTIQSRNDPQIPDLGYVILSAQFPIQDLLDGKFEDFSLLDQQIVNGQVEVNNVGFYQSFLQNTFAQAEILTQPGKPVTVTGTLKNPKIGGEIYLSAVKTVIPSLNQTSSAAGTPIFNPNFDLKFFLSDPANIRSSTAEVNVTGNGSLTGNLANMTANALFVVENGALTLPGGKVKLTPDGTLELKYRNSQFENRSELNANLHGETALTALKNGTTPERYDISIDIRGDMFSDNGLTLDATSQPGDLSRDRILQLLGRTDLISDFLQSGVNSSLETELRNTLFGLGLPQILNSLTSELAKGFNLDYFGVDYNAFEGTSLNFAKSLGGGLFLQGRQQVFQPLPGQPAAYDYRIAYRPRRGPNALRALSFSIGMDQYRPYKFQIDFTNRIRTRKPAYRTIILGVPTK